MYVTYISIICLMLGVWRSVPVLTIIYTHVYMSIAVNIYKCIYTCKQILLYNMPVIHNIQRSHEAPSSSFTIVKRSVMNYTSSRID